MYAIRLENWLGGKIMTMKYFFMILRLNANLSIEWVYLDIGVCTISPLT